MRDYGIICDSCCDLSGDELREMELTVLSLNFIMDGKTYADSPMQPEIEPKAFFDKVRAGSMCTTSAVSVGTFETAMRQTIEAGKDVLCICLSSGISTTYQSAVIAAEELRGEFPDAKIIVIDSLSASRGLGLLLHYAVEKKRSGAAIEETADYVRTLIPQNHHYVMVEDLAHLRRGGRVSSTTAFFGSMLQIKPLIQVSTEGKLEVFGKARGVSAAIKNMADKMEQLGNAPLADQVVYICHADCEDYAKQLSTMLHERFGVKDIRIGFIGPVIGSHTGGGTLGLFFLGSAR